MAPQERMLRLNSYSMSGRRKRSPVPEVFTVGYEGRDLDELVGLLHHHGIRVLVDVRLNAISRRRGFSKSVLAETLADAGIAYVHERGLGNPKDNRADYRVGKTSAHRRYARHLKVHGADAFARVTDLVKSTPTALLCVEREPNCCHRTAIATELDLTVISL